MPAETAGAAQPATNRPTNGRRRARPAALACRGNGENLPEPRAWAPLSSDGALALTPLLSGDLCAIIVRGPK
jgi:hypothetical protein